MHSGGFPSMRFVVPVVAALLAVVAATPLAAQQIGAPLTTQPAQKAKPPSFHSAS